jgi:hypothetical protein
MKEARRRERGRETKLMGRVGEEKIHWELIFLPLRNNGREDLAK